MSDRLDPLVALGLLCAATHWLIARSVIAKPLWSRARGRLDELLRCAGCSGWWLGLIAGIAGLRPIGHGVIGALLSGLLGVVLTPVVEAVLLWALAQTAIERDDEAD